MTQHNALTEGQRIAFERAGFTVYSPNRYVECECVNGPFDGQTFQMAREYLEAGSGAYFAEIFDDGLRYVGYLPEASGSTKFKHDPDWRMPPDLCTPLPFETS